MAGGAAQGHLGALSFSPDGKHVLTSCPSEISLWDAATGKLVRSLSAPADFYSDAAFSPDGRRIVTASLHKTARIWDAATGKELVPLVGHEGFIGSAAFSPDGSLVVTVATDRRDRTCRLWDPRSGKQVGTLKDENYASCGRFQSGRPASADLHPRRRGAASGRSIRCPSRSSACRVS